jgi:CAAX amino terminal protease family protein
MLKRLRTAHPLVFCVLAEVVFLASLFVTDLIFTIVLVLFRADFSALDTYLYSTLQELVGALVAVLFLVRTDRAGLLRRRGSGFFNGLLVGMYPLFFIGYTTVGTLAFDRPDTPLLPLPRILTFMLNMILVGVAEELVFRGIIAQTLLERYGTARAGVWKACLVSGVLFGAAHLSNLLGSEAFGVLMQCVFAASLGVMLAAIYFRTGNLWVTVFLHSAMDIAAMLIGGLYGTTSVAESVSGYDASRLLSVAVYLIPTVFLLRKKKLPEVQLYWGGIVKN